MGRGSANRIVANREPRCPVFLGGCQVAKFSGGGPRFASGPTKSRQCAEFEMYGCRCLTLSARVGVRSEIHERGGGTAGSTLNDSDADVWRRGNRSTTLFQFRDDHRVNIEARNDDGQAAIGLTDFQLGAARLQVNAVNAIVGTERDVQVVDWQCFFA